MYKKMRRKDSAFLSIDGRKMPFILGGGYFLEKIYFKNKNHFLYLKFVLHRIFLKKILCFQTHFADANGFDNVVIGVHKAHQIDAFGQI